MAELRDMAAISDRARSTAVRLLRRALVGLCWFTGVTAVAGGVGLLLQPKGGESAPLTLLAGTPFDSFVVPGLLLAGVVGLANLVAGTLVFRRHRTGDLAAFGAGVTLTTWIIVQILLLAGPVHWLQALYLAVGLATIGGAGWLARLRRAAVQ